MCLRVIDSDSTTYLRFESESAALNSNENVCRRSVDDKERRDKLEIDNANIERLVINVFRDVLVVEDESAGSSHCFAADHLLLNP